MSSPRLFNTTCPCSKQEKVVIQVEVMECPNEKTEFPYNPPCPHANEAGCHKYVTITLPPGIRPAVKAFINRTK